jgi:hypothetical protein
MLAGTFSWSEDPSLAWLVTFYCRTSHLMKTGFFRQVMDLKNERKNPQVVLLE